MIINNFSENVLDSGGKKVSAEIHWEDCDRPVKEIYFEVSKEHKDKTASNDLDLYTAVNAKVFGARIGSASNQRLKTLKEKFGKVDKKIFGGKIRSLKRQIDKT